jgi:phospholipid/cholesterol/gamma-HCH transport system substrate-binding protein
MLDNETGSLAKTLSNANSIAENLKKNNDSITTVISNAKRFSERLSHFELEKTIDSIQQVVSEMKSAVSKITNNNGTLGALINDKTLYNKLNDAILSAEILMDDMRTHPKRYVNISVFGKKDKGGPLTSPLKKDSIPVGGH